MKSPYGKLVALICALCVGLLLFAPMRSGTEDYLFARPRVIRMNRGDSYSIVYRLYSDTAQRVVFSSTNENVASVSREGVVSAIAPGKTRILLDAENGARAQVQVEVAGSGQAALTLNTARLNMEKGQVTGLQAIFSEDVQDTSVTWTSMNDRVARVDTAGRVSAVGGGSTRVFATARNGISASAEVYVHVSGSAMRITPEDLVVGEGAFTHLDASYFPVDTTDEVVRWTTSDPDVIIVQDDGAILAVREGQAVISAFSGEGLTTSAVVVVERGASDFEISPTGATIDRGGTLKLEARFLNDQGQTDERSSEHYITWASSNPDVASVENGVVTALRSGLTRITASADGKVATCNLAVQTLVQEVRLDRDEVFLLREQTVDPIRLKAEVFPADADDTRIAFFSDNDLVATVSEDGLVTLVGGYGTATITARAVSGAQARFVVNVVAELPQAAGN